MAQIPGENTRDAWRDKKHSSLGSNYMFWGLHNDEDPNVMYNILTGTYEANVTAKNRLSSNFFYVRKVHVAVGNDIDAFLLEATVGDEKSLLLISDAKYHTKIYWPSGLNKFDSIDKIVASEIGL